MKHLAAGPAALLLLVAGIAATGPSAAAPARTCQGRPVTIAATADREKLQGTDSSDVISAYGFDDVSIQGNGGDDVLCAGSGQRTVLLPGPGADSFVGNATTILTFVDERSGVQVDLAAGTVVNAGETDTVAGVHRVVGTTFHDTFVGSPTDDTYTTSWRDSDGDLVSTGSGDDTVNAGYSEIHLGPGDDTATGPGGAMFGDAGDDRIYLAQQGTVDGGPGDDEIRTEYNIEGYGYVAAAEFTVLGGPGRDVIAQPATVLEGGASCPGEACARATIDGGPGRDRLDGRRRHDLVVDLDAGTASSRTGEAQVSSIEDVEGSALDDVIRGDARGNHVDGNGGDDVLVGRSGADRLHGKRGRDQAFGGPGRDECEAEVRRSC